MAIFSGSMTYLRFSVLGSLPNQIVGHFEKVLSVRRFIPLHPEGRDTETSGWVPLNTPYLDDAPLLSEQFLFGERVVLGYREDKLSIPKPLLKDLVEKRLREFPDKNRQMLEEIVVSELRQRILPKSRVIDVLWDLSRSELRLFGRGQGVLERFERLFEQTFHLQLKQLTYPEIAQASQVSLRSKGILENLSETVIFGT
ncbi:MAG: hypothetical protein I8H75_04695 [Myxococcaceae bacterium]|nr:hypothetical protein [Myxococcaceae bacterium]MBH2006622.1 hypothetical protein [Myxococcaceae bacterium]